MNYVPNLHIKVPVWALLAVTLADVGLVTFGDPATTLGTPSWSTAIFKTVLAMVGVLLMVFVAPSTDTTPPTNTTPGAPTNVNP